LAIPAVAGLLVILPCQLCMVNCYWLPQSMAYYFPRGFVYSADVDDGLCVYSGLCVHMWRFVHQWSFLLFWLSWLNLTIDTLYQSISIVKNSQNHWCTNRHRSTKTVSTVYQSSKTVKNCQKTVKTAKMTIGVPIVICLPRLYQRCTNCQKQSKQQKLPLVYQSSHVYTLHRVRWIHKVCVRIRRIHKAFQSGSLDWFQLAAYQSNFAACTHLSRKVSELYDA